MPIHSLIVTDRLGNTLFLKVFNRSAHTTFFSELNKKIPKVRENFDILNSAGIEHMKFVSRITLGTME
jgi:hypothetical protein